ncbi:MAG: hypothetical protein WA139_05930 [Candidatus Aenigmatarchaeota archaeon]
MGEKCNCDFYSVRTGDWQNQAAANMYRNNKLVWGHCTTHTCPLDGSISGGKEAYAINDRTVIPFECWLNILRG